MANAAEPVPARPSERLVRTALLSARLFIDSLMPNSVVRFGSPGVMKPLDAFAVLVRDGQVAAEADGSRPHVPYSARARLVTAGLQAVDLQQQQSRKEGLPSDPELVKIRAELEALANTVQREFAGLPHETRVNNYFAAPLDAATSLADPPDLPYARKWSTRVVPTSGPMTHIVSEVEVLAELRLVAMLCDPRRWSEDSLFWLVTEGSDFDPAEPPKLDLEDPKIRKRAKATSWRGRLHEEVAGLAIFAVELGIDFEVTDERCKLKYWWIDSPSGIKADNGELTVRPITVDDKPTGWLKARVTKAIDFEDAAFGGPSSGDLLAPSFFASWMRVQQDAWISRIQRFSDSP